MSTPLDPQQVFERFVVGPANRLAAAAAHRVAESAGRSYNPLVISGAPGLGKTHLLMAIGQFARSVDPEMLVHYEPMEAFVDRLTTSLAEGTIDELRATMGGVGMLLLDDLQVAAGKARTQDELLRLWEELVGRGAQVVVAADRAPQEIPALDARLGSRLAAGLIVEVGPPEVETRLGILRQLLRDRGREMEDEVVEALARLPIDNARELQGALNRILAAVEIENRELDAGQVSTLLGVAAPDEAAAGNEFEDFLSDLSTAVAAVVETSPWRKRIAREILRWEGEGIRTRRLEQALDADSAPDVDALLHGFARDVARLRSARARLAAPPADPHLFTDPDRAAEAEALLQRQPPAPLARPRGAEPRAVSLDAWFLDAEKLAWDWLALDDRLVEERG